jgi:hypothetical protein
MVYTIEKKKYSDEPFLSIITRRYIRPEGFEKNQSSINCLVDKDIEQIFIIDSVGHGMLNANKSFSLPEVKSIVSGKYVFLLDDDDYITNPFMTIQLKSIAESTNADVIFFKMFIKNKNMCLYPTPNQWKNNTMFAGSIGGSCFVVKNEIYQKHIENFGHVRMGDFNFINAVMKTNPNVYWLDKQMSETGRVSRGAKE